MAFTNTRIGGRPLALDQDDASGLFIQDPKTTKGFQNMGSSTTTNGLWVPGKPVVAVGRLYQATGLAAPATLTFTPFSANAPCKLFVKDCGFIVESIAVADFTNGDGGNLDFIVNNGANPVCTIVLDDDYANDTRDDGTAATATWDATYVLVAADGSLSVTLVQDPDDTAVGAAGTTAAVSVLAWVEVIPVT